MGREALTSTCDSFGLTLLRPDVDAPHTLEGTAEIAPGSSASSVKVTLALFAHYRQRIGYTGIAGEAPIAQRSVSVGRGDGAQAFTLELPAVARASSGAHLRIEPGVLATSDDGETLRVIIPASWQPGTESELIVRDLPRTESTGGPRLLLFALALAVLIAGAVLLGVGAPRDVAWMGQLGLGLLVIGAVGAGFSNRGVLGYLRVGRARVTLERHERDLRVRVRASHRATGGRVFLRAAEYDVYEGADNDLGERAVSEASALAREGEELVGVVSLPPPGAAVPSLTLRSTRRRVGIRWSVILELTTRSGSIARFDVPVAIGIVYKDSGRDDVAGASC